jgi:hypothetical protein
MIIRHNGFAQLTVLFGLLLTAIALPAVSYLAQNSQDNRNRAAHSCSETTHPSNSCVISGITYGYTCDTNTGIWKCEVTAPVIVVTLIPSNTSTPFPTVVLGGPSRYECPNVTGTDGGPRPCPPTATKVPTSKPIPSNVICGSSGCITKFLTPTSTKVCPTGNTGAKCNGSSGQICQISQNSDCSKTCVCTKVTTIPTIKISPIPTTRIIGTVTPPLYGNAPEACNAYKKCSATTTCVAGKCLGDFGSSCNSPADCASGFCTQYSNGSYSVKVCVKSTTTNYECDSHLSCPNLGQVCNGQNKCVMANGGACASPKDCISSKCDQNGTCVPIGYNPISADCNANKPCTQLGTVCGPNNTCLMANSSGCYGDSQCVSFYCKKNNTTGMGTCMPLSDSGSICSRSQSCKSKVCNKGFCQ